MEIAERTSATLAFHSRRDSESGRCADAPASRPHCDHSVNSYRTPGFYTHQASRAHPNERFGSSMSDLCRLIWCALIGLFRSRAALEAAILVLRHQLNVLRRKSPKRLAFGNMDRLVFAALYRVAPGVLDDLRIL